MMLISMNEDFFYDRECRLNCLDQLFSIDMMRDEYDECQFDIDIERDENETVQLLNQS
jgi:hypothetical protein